ncbi:hypothetical protein KCTC52924_02606 [Arenibacter antarcticus]|uniref:Uncharacterized protein n=1 Tax=Arenibacter antarcticus TaxID=2040469 RepID=A0ABW5VHX5_9FLAO|nr:hypothetical protein [Arenibacter sp. H213]
MDVYVVVYPNGVVVPITVAAVKLLMYGELSMLLSDLITGII